MIIIRLVLAGTISIGKWQFAKTIDFDFFTTEPKRRIIKANSNSQDIKAFYIRLLYLLRLNEGHIH